jgi:CheY-like chemotaxis protein
MPQLPKILIVDDEALLLKALLRVLRNQRYHVEATTDVIEALELLSTFRPDLVLADYLMPGMNGVEFLERARELQPDAVRVLIGATGPGALMDPALKPEQKPFDHFLAKPWSNEVFVSEIARFLQGRVPRST